MLIIELLFALLLSFVATPTYDIDTLTDAPACLTEDQVSDCYWDAAKHGNGEGRSFAVDNGEVIYLD